MAISIEGSKPKNFKKIVVPAGCKFVHNFGLHPSFEMAITPSFYEQIEKSSSTPQDRPNDIFRTYVARVHVPKNVS